METRVTFVTHVLEKTISPDNNDLIAAETFLKHATHHDFADFMKILSDVIVQEGHSEVARSAAGLQIKNQLTSKDPVLNLQNQRRWLALPNDTKLYIKNNILAAVGTEQSRPSIAAQCITHIACAELPIGQWNDLIPILAGNINDNSTDTQKAGCLEALNYICNDMQPEVIKAKKNEILTAIAQGLMLKQPNDHIRIAATQALLHLLDYTKENFMIEHERNYIMEMVCGSSQSSNTRIVEVALDCLIKIVELYYEYIDPYMAPAVIPITLDALDSQVEEISVKGITFWSDVVKKEMIFASEEAEAAAAGLPPIGISRFYARDSIKRLAPSLIKKFDQDFETDYELAWNPSKAVSMCLILLLHGYGDETATLLSSFIERKIKNTNWRFRDCAITAYESVIGTIMPTASNSCN